MEPIGTMGRAAQASIQRKMGSMPPDQAIAYTEQLLLDNISPDLETMMAQAQQLRQMQQKQPQMTIRDQLNQAYQGIAQLPTPGFEPGFAGGGIVGDAVAFANGGPPRLTPDQIALQMQRQRAAEAGYRFRDALPGMRLEDFPELIEDAPDSVRTQIVDDQGNIWQRGKDGKFRLARSAAGAQGFGISGLRDVDSPMRRDINAYREGRGFTASEGIKPSAAPSGPAAEAPAASTKKPGFIRQGIGALAPVAVAGGTGAMIGDVGERVESQRGEGADTGPVIPIGPMGVAYSTKSAPKPGDIGDMFSSLFSGATLGFFGDREADRAAERKPEAKPAEKPAPKPAPRPADVAGDVVNAKRQGVFDIPIAIESARANIENAVTEDGEYKKLLARAEKEGTGPFSKMFTEGDRIKAERLKDLEKRKDSSFGRALVAAGLAMAEQASKGGQPGNEVQKFLASAVAGLGGYMKAQTYLEEEIGKSQKEVDKFTLDMEQLREASQGELRGSALKRFNDAQARAEKARDNAKGLMIVQYQMDQARDLAGLKSATTLQAGRERAQAQLMSQATKEVAESPAYMTAELEHARATTDAERNAATAKMNNLIQQRAQMNMQNPAYMAGINYNLGSGDLDFSAVDAIVNAALPKAGP
jgi:hypothetical protein